MHRLISALAVASVVLVAAGQPASAGGAAGAYSEVIVLPGPSSGAYTDTSGAGSSAANDGEPTGSEATSEEQPLALQR